VSYISFPSETVRETSADLSEVRRWILLMWQRDPLIFGGKRDAGSGKCFPASSSAILCSCDTGTSRLALQF